jgi:hypothetical protein
MQVIKEGYFIPVSVVDITIKKLLMDGQKDAALTYFLLHTNPDLVQDDGTIKILEDYGLYQEKKLYNNIIGDNGEKIDFLSELKKQQETKTKIAMNEGKINADVLTKMFEDIFFTRYGYPYKSKITSVELGMFKYLITTYGKERAKNIVEKCLDYWDVNKPITVEGLVKIAPTIPYYEKGAGSWD